MARNDDDQDFDTTGLSAEELAALEDENGTADEDEELDPEALAALAKDEEGEPSDEEPAETEPAEAEGNADDEAGEPPAEEENEAVDRFGMPMVQLDVPAVEDFEAQMENIKADKQALRAKLDEGEIDLNEYEQQKDALVSKETQLLIAQNNALSMAKQNEHLAKQRWEWEQESFFSRKANALYNQEDYLGVAARAALNQAVKDLARKPENADKPGSFFLNEADRLVREQFKLPALEKKETTPPGSRRPKEVIPPSLAGMPAAEIEEANNGGEFAALDNLDGLALEQALAKLSPEQQERYLRG